MEEEGEKEIVNLLLKIDMLFVCLFLGKCLFVTYDMSVRMALREHLKYVCNTFDSLDV